MRLPGASALVLIGILAAGSTALGYYYYYFYDPPRAVAEAFMKAMEERDADALKRIVLISDGAESEKFRDPEDRDIEALLKEPFTRGRILDQGRREGGSRNLDYLVYRDTSGQIYALFATTVVGQFRIVVSERPFVPEKPFLWGYDWKN